MGFISERLNVRVTEEVRKKVEDLMRLDSERYENLSSVIRIAIMKLHREETSNVGNTTRKERKARFEFE